MNVKGGCNAVTPQGKDCPETSRPEENTDVQVFLKETTLPGEAGIISLFMKRRKKSRACVFFIFLNETTLLSPREWGLL